MSLNNCGARHQVRAIFENRIIAVPGTESVRFVETAVYRKPQLN